VHFFFLWFVRSVGHDHRLGSFSPRWNRRPAPRGARGPGHADFGVMMCLCARFWIICRQGRRCDLPVFVEDCSSGGKTILASPFLNTRRREDPTTSAGQCSGRRVKEPKQRKLRVARRVQGKLEAKLFRSMGNILGHRQKEPSPAARQQPKKTLRKPYHRPKKVRRAARAAHGSALV